MKKNKPVKITITGLIIFILFLFSQAHALAFAPDWVRSHKTSSYKLQGFYHGIGFASFADKSPNYQEMRLAKDRALDELSYSLSVSIKSKLEGYIVKKGNFEEQHIASSLFVSTRKFLSGIKEEKKWTDKKNATTGSCWSLIRPKQISNLRSKSLLIRSLTGWKTSRMRF